MNNENNNIEKAYQRNYQNRSGYENRGGYERDYGENRGGYERDYGENRGGYERDYGENSGGSEESEDDKYDSYDRYDSSRYREKEDSKSDTDYPLTSKNFELRHLKEKSDGIIISMEDYYNPSSENPDELSEPSKEVISEIKYLDTKMISGVIIKEMIGVLAVLIDSDNVNKRIIGYNALKDLLKFIENKYNYYNEIVDEGTLTNRKGETLFRIISNLNTDYLCNDGTIPEISRKDPRYKMYISQLDIIKSIRLLWKRDVNKDVIKSTSLVYDPFPVNKNDINRRSSTIKTKCNRRGGYDRYNDYNYSPEQEHSRYDRYENRRGGYDRYEDRRGGYDRYEDRRGGYDRYEDRRDGYDRYEDRRGGYDRYNDYTEMYGGNDIELNKLREDIGRTNFDIELNRLRNELFIIRNNL